MRTSKHFQQSGYLLWLHLPHGSKAVGLHGVLDEPMFAGSAFYCLYDVRMLLEQLIIQRKTDKLVNSKSI